MADEESIDLLSSVLKAHGWAPLSCNPSEEELLSFVSSNESYQLSLISEPPSPSLMQFFYSLYGFGTSTDTYDILVSTLPFDESSRQEYRMYSGESMADLLFFIEDIKQKPAFIFQGTFAPLIKGRNQEMIVTWRRRQRTLNAICVDIDGASFVDRKDPLSADVLSYLLDILPEEIVPSYITLTGNGVHCWYFFDAPLQVFSQNTVRNRKLTSLIRGLYRCYDVLLEGMDAEVDYSCASLNHCFRAPGSLTKKGTDVLLFSRPEYARLFYPHDLSLTVRDLLAEEYPERDMLTEDDCRFKSSQQLARESQARREANSKLPATEKQLELLEELVRSGSVEEEEIPDDVTKLQAADLISKGFAQAHSHASKRACAYDYSGWQIKPHWLNAGSTGGVYNTILGRIQEVKIGRRYSSLFMLAGVAYMMVNPVKPLSSVRRDFMGLLQTSWAQQGQPLTERDVNNALKGYTANNWQTVNSIVKALGFYPFGPPAKRNNRTREEHLSYIASTKRESCLKKMVPVIKENPDASKKDVIEKSGLSKPTVYKYWDDAHEMAQSSLEQL